MAPSAPHLPTVAPAWSSSWMMAGLAALAAMWRGVWPLVSYLLFTWLAMAPSSSPCTRSQSAVSTAAWRGNLWALSCRGSGAISHCLTVHTGQGRLVPGPQLAGRQTVCCPMYTLTSPHLTSLLIFISSIMKETCSLLLINLSTPINQVRRYQVLRDFSVAIIQQIPGQITNKT